MTNYVNSHHLVAVVTDEPRFSDGKANAFLRFSIRYSEKHPTKDVSMVLFHQIRLFGDLATKHGPKGSEDDLIRLGDIVELKGRLQYETQSDKMVTVVDEVGGELAILGQVDDEEYNELKEAFDSREAQFAANRAKQQADAPAKSAGGRSAATEKDAPARGDRSAPARGAARSDRGAAKPAAKAEDAPARPARGARR